MNKHSFLFRDIFRVIHYCKCVSWYNYDWSLAEYKKATSANLKAGEMGLVTAKKGLGKTSILVQFAIDSLLDGNALVHVSFDQKSSNVISWYSSVLSEIVLILLRWKMKLYATEQF